MTISKAELKKLASLNTKKGRSEQKSFLASGVRVLEEALKFAFIPVKLLYSRSDISERGQKLVNQYKAKNVEVVAFSPREMHSISDTETGQGVLGVFNVPEMNLSKLYKPSFRRLLLCDQINDPGNLGTLVRSAMAFEFDMMLVTDNSVELFNPKVVRSSAGAIFAMPVAKVSCRELAEFKMLSKAKLAAAVSLHDGINNDSENPDSLAAVENSLIVAIGSEAEGLSEDVLALADYRISIWHNSKVESLNVAVAGSILMHEISKTLKKKVRE